MLPEGSPNTIRNRVQQIVDSYSLCLDDQGMVEACADDVIEYLLDWPARRERGETNE